MEHFPLVGAQGSLDTPWVLLVIYLIITTAGYLVYRQTQHPLYRFPGPKLAAWTRFYSAAVVLTGNEHVHLENAHRKYGESS